MLAKRYAANSWYNSTMQQLFRETCAIRAEKTSIVFEDRKISFSELREQVDRLSWALLQLGVKQGDRVAMLPTPSPEFTYLFFAVLQIGAWINPLNLLWGEIELNGILPCNDPKLIVTIDENGGRDYVELLKSAIPDLEIGPDRVSSASVPSLNLLVSLSRLGKKYEGFLDFDELLSGGENYEAERIERLVAQSKPTDIQFLCQTSGSTGLSKSAMWDHRPPLSSAHFFGRALLLGEQDSYLNIAPYYHNSGVVAAMTLNLAYLGTTLYLMENFHPQTALEIMQKYRPNVSFGFDAHWQAMRKVKQAGIGEFTLNKVVAATTPSNYPLLVEDMVQGDETRLSTLYAQTENGPLVSLVEPDCVDKELRQQTVGRPLPGVQLVIKDQDTGEAVTPGQQGEICYKSPYLFRGYYRQEEETRKCFDEEGYFHSGDYGSFEDGYLRFYGRLGGVVKSGGENVSTTYVSAILMKIFADEFEDAHTVGVPDPYWGTKLVTWVRLPEGQKLRSFEEIKAECKGKMAQYEIPKQLLVWEGPWPTTEIGKIDLKVLEKKALEHVEEEGRSEN